MEVLYILVPIGVLLAGVIGVVFLWAVKSGQFDDLEGPAHRILMDDDGQEGTGAASAGADDQPPPGDTRDPKR